MKTPRLVVAVFLLLPIVAVAQEKGMLVGDGSWAVVKSEAAPPDTQMVFTADGKLTVKFAVDGKPREMTGTFTLAGNQLTLKLSQDGRERVETRTIKKLTEGVLITEDKNKKVEELHFVKKK
jgi:uncharacterized protein (TIGR03066 family)